MANKSLNFILRITDTPVILHMLTGPNCSTEQKEENNFQAQNQLLNQRRKILPSQEKGCLVDNTTFWIKAASAGIETKF